MQTFSLNYVPHIIGDAQLRAETIQLLDIVVPKEKPSSGDYSQAAICLLALIKDRKHEDICLLMSTIVEITEILYANDDKRNTVAILRLHNLTWLHHELCRQLFHKLHTLSRQKFFGLYLHALSCHAIKQYEVLCLKSCNAENEEHLFGQAKTIALNITNRQPGNVLPNVLLCLQAKQLQNEMANAQNHLSKKISQEARAVYISQNTKISLHYISQRLDSWQAHLEDLSCYLIEGEGAWWKCTDQEQTFEFLDVNLDEHPVHPKLQHYRTSELAELKMMKVQAWKDIINLDIKLPTLSIKLYNEDGNFLSRKVFPHWQMSTTLLVLLHLTWNQHLMIIQQVLQQLMKICLLMSNDFSVSNSEECIHTEHPSTIVHAPVNLEEVYDHGSEPSTSVSTSDTAHLTLLICQFCKQSWPKFYTNV